MALFAAVAFKGSRKTVVDGWAAGEQSSVGQRRCEMHIGMTGGYTFPNSAKTVTDTQPRIPQQAQHTFDCFLYLRGPDANVDEQKVKIRKGSKLSATIPTERHDSESALGLFHYGEVL